MTIPDLVPALVRRYGPAAVREVDRVVVEVDAPRGRVTVYRFPRGLKWRFLSQTRLQSGPPSKLLLQLGDYDDVPPGSLVRIIRSHDGVAHQMEKYGGRLAEVLAAVGPFLVVAIEGVDGPRGVLRIFARPERPAVRGPGPPGTIAAHGG